MKIGRFLRPTSTLVAGMVALAVVEMAVPKVASIIVSAGSKVKKMVGGK